MNEIFYWHEYKYCHPSKRKSFAFKAGKQFSNMYHLFVDIIGKAHSSYTLPNMEVGIKVAVAYVHPEDQFCRKTGREVALNKLDTEQDEMYKVILVTTDRDGTHIYLAANSYASEEESREHLGTAANLVLSLTKKNTLMLKCIG